MAKRIALLISGMLAVYLIIASIRGIELLFFNDPLVRVLGLAVLVIPALGVIFIIREIRFGKLSYVMGQLIDVSYLPQRDLNESAKNDFLEKAIAEAKNEMENWQAWYGVALGYDLVNERKLAREAMSHSVNLFQVANPK